MFIAVAILVCFFVVFSGVITAYVYKFGQQLAKENEIRLSEVSDYIVKHMTTVVMDTQGTLQAVASAVAALDSPQARMTLLEKISEQYSFAYMGYAGPDGLLHATIASESVNVSATPYFQNALHGTPTVSNQIRKIFTNRAASGILLAVPTGQGARSGVLVSMLETKKLRDVLRLQSFGGAGYTYIIDQKGMVIMRTRSLDFGNLFVAWKGLHFQEGYSLEKMSQDIAASKPGLSSFDNIAGIRQYAYYRPLPFNNWAVVNVVSEQAVSAETTMLTRELAVIGGAIVLVFIGLLIWAMRSRQVSQENKLAAEAKSAFLANMSHEIRTPMNAIVGLSEIMLRDELTSTHRDQLTSILNSGKGLLTIINDILDISKIESGNFAIIDSPYELESLLYDITIIAAIRIGESPLKFLLELDPALPRYLIGDMGRVKQVLLNIVGNAIKFTERGSIRLIIDGEKDEQGWLLRIEVRDTGMGIKADDLGKMFLRFSQVDTKRNRNIEGTGLGLTISQKLCQMMGGHIEVSSEYGKGTSFVITIRQGEGEALPLLHPVADVLSLLVYEPSQTLRTFEASCMEKLGIAYTMCTDAEEFEAKLHAGGYTHALASRNVLRQLHSDAIGTTHLIGLLELKDHSLMDTKGTNIYLPLFAMHLPHVLSGEFEHFRAARHSRVDNAMIDPMPHVSVLVVDDNELNIMVAEGIMAPYEMQIHHAYSGKAAINAVQKQEYDLVLMDHMMPEMDGIEAAQRIRQLPDPKYKHLPIVALTANTTSEARQMFIDAGFDDFLAKPIETDKLNKVLVTFLKDINTQRALTHEALPVSEAVPAPRVQTLTQVTSAAVTQAPVAPAGEVDFTAGQKLLPSRSFYIRILRAYALSTGEKLDTLPHWMEHDQQRTLIEIHGLKSASASIGAIFFSEKAQHIETLGKLGQIDDVKAALPDFIAQGQRVIAEIEAFLAQERCVSSDKE